jgi:hypothetical protein
LEQGLFGDNGSDVAANPKVRYDVLARGVPAMSFAVAPNPLHGVVNFDMEEEGRDSSRWPAEGHGGFRTGNWIHSDFKNLALLYVAPMYDAMISKGGLKSK